jgi:hypothetical protein
MQSIGPPKLRESQLWKRHKVYYKGEGGGLPQVRAVMNLVNSSLPVVFFNTKSAQIMH